MRQEAQVFKALSNETRLRIIILLTYGELCVCELEEVLNTTQSKISRHLSYLKNAGLVEDRRSGLWIHYSIKKSKMPLQKSLMKCLKRCFTEDSIVTIDFKRLEKRLKEKGKC